MNKQNKKYENECIKISCAARNPSWQRVCCWAACLRRTAQTLSLPAQTNQYRMASNYVAGTAAPYNAGGGVPAQALLTLSTNTSTNCTFSWYGMRGWTTVQAPLIWSIGLNLANVEATDIAGASRQQIPLVLLAVSDWPSPTIMPAKTSAAVAMATSIAAV